MCKQPIHILNPKLKASHSNFNLAVDNLMLEVACGKCAECQIRKQQDWLTRLAYEYEYTLAVGGYCLFETFTYREEEVPRTHGLMCFSKKDYSLFASELRTYLTRHYERMFRYNQMPDEIFNMPYLYNIEPKELINDGNEETDDHLWSFNVIYDKSKPTRPDYYPAGKVKIFFVSEYGGEYGRPHHHALIFVQYKIKPQTMLYYIKKSWTKGFIGAGGANTKIVNSMRGIAYVSKYVCKDIEFAKAVIDQKNSKFLPYLQNQWRKVYNEELNLEEFRNYPCSMIQKCMKELGMDSAIPYIKASHHLGEYGLQHITKRNLELNEISIGDNKRGAKIVPIPEYLRRKMLFDYDKQIKYWQLNDMGKLIRGIRQEDTMQNTIRTVNDVFTYWIDRCNDYNAEYYKKMYADVYKNKHTWGKLIELIFNRNRMISNDIIRYIENGDFNDQILQEKKKIMDTAYISDVSRVEPFDWVMRRYLEKEIYTVGQMYFKLYRRTTYDERFEYLVKAYEDITNRLRLSRNNYKQYMLEAEHFVKQLKTKIL